MLDGFRNRVQTSLAVEPVQGLDPPPWLHHESSEV